MSRFVLYFDDKKTKINLNYAKVVDGEDTYCRIRAVLDRTDDVMGECIFRIGPKKSQFRYTIGEEEKPAIVCYLSNKEEKKTSFKINPEYADHGIETRLLKAMENVAFSMKADHITVYAEGGEGTLLSYACAHNGYWVSGSLAGKDKLERHNDILNEDIPEIESFDEAADLAPCLTKSR